MSDIPAILERRCTKVSIAASSRKALLQYASDLLAEAYELPARKLFDELMNRERLGSTGLGEGVALPHGRLDGLDSTVAAFVRIPGGVDFDAPDRNPVDLVFAMVCPLECTEEHLEILSSLAETFSDDGVRERLRGDLSSQTAWEILGRAGET